jgi:hypothetical protein
MLNLSGLAVVCDTDAADLWNVVDHEDVACTQLPVKDLKKNRVSNI